MIEIYKTIEGYPNYEISNMGNVRRGKRKLKNLLHKKTGYNMVCLYNESGCRRFNIHRLVAEAFIPNPNNYPVVNHKDENKQNNMVWVNEDGSIDYDKSNLEWCTQSYNIKYGSSIKKIRESKQRGCLQMDMDGNVIKEWDCIKVAQKTLKISHIVRCCRGKQNTAGGFKWKYAR